MSDNRQNNPVEMRSQAEKADNQAEAVQGAIDGMDGIVNYLTEVWKGPAYDTYAQRYETLRKSIVDAKDLICEIAGALRSSADAYDDTESNVSRGWQG